MKPDSLKPPEALCGQITFICTGLELSHPEHFQIKGALDCGRAKGIIGLTTTADTWRPCCCMFVPMI